MWSKLLGKDTFALGTFIGLQEMVTNTQCENIIHKHGSSRVGMVGTSKISLGIQKLHLEHFALKPL